ncbi:N-acetyltransferase [Reticulibacter mediterranei]|uniref:N-acetyltransferase n=1 Tax=Reticulibacter mediterranei TaxID=2778369 RepID=A0A8J3MY11_9CHLR|nr:GNAT family N-acetyltransferase [Reticulibacter mediterranei]GHO91509.1 N-acetyltransferase [Reticulibacter mediterranei]
MDTPFIRLAAEQDIDQLIPLYTEFHEFHVLGVPDRLRRPDIYDEAWLRDALHTILSNDDAALFVVDSGEELLGLAEVYLRQDEPHSLTVAHRYGYLQSLIISASHRKKGLGKQLVTAAQQWAKERDATEMQLDTWEFETGPLVFYESLGYRTLKRYLVTDLS